LVACLKQFVKCLRPALLLGTPPPESDNRRPDCVGEEERVN
jgi:hypothetical protein